MKINIQGNGSFGTFLKELLSLHFELVTPEEASSIVLAVPISAYNELGKKFKDKHLINVCSVQLPSTNILLKHTDNVTSLHPLFGKRTPKDKRNTILTYSCIKDNDTWQSSHLESEFLEQFKKVSAVIDLDMDGNKFTPEKHDILMRNTHVEAVLAAKELKLLIDRTNNIPDQLIPNSFRLMREFVKTLDDMPIGTLDSIMKNPYL